MKLALPQWFSQSIVFGVSSAFLVFSNFAQASTLATDIADNYGGGNPWVNTSNQGTGFGAWNLSNNNNDNATNFAGYFLGDSTAGTGNVNSPTQSFAIYANPGSAFADASRTLTGGALSEGQAITLKIGVNLQNGNKGFSLYSGASEVANFNVGSNDYQFQGGSLGFASSATSVFSLTFTQTTSTNLAVNITRGTDVFDTNLTVSGIDSFKFYNSGTADGANGNNLYFNNLAVVPEPSTWVLAGGSLLLFVTSRRFRGALQS